MKIKFLVVTLLVFMLLTVAVLPALAFSPVASPPRVADQWADTLTAAMFLALVNYSLIEAVLDPAKKKYPGVDWWWMAYVSWLTGGLISFLCQIDLLTPLVPNMPPVLGVGLTAIIVGGGASLISKVFKAKISPV